MNACFLGYSLLSVRIRCYELKTETRKTRCHYGHYFNVPMFVFHFPACAPSAQLQLPPKATGVKCNLPRTENENETKTPILNPTTTPTLRKSQNGSPAVACLVLTLA